MGIMSWLFAAAVCSGVEGEALWPLIVGVVREEGYCTTEGSGIRRAEDLQMNPTGELLQWQVSTVDREGEWVATAVVLAPTGQSIIEGFARIDPPHWTTTLDPYVSL